MSKHGSVQVDKRLWQEAKDEAQKMRISDMIELCGPSSYNKIKEELKITVDSSIFYNIWKLLNVPTVKSSKKTKNFRRPRKCKEFN